LNTLKSVGVFVLTFVIIFVAMYFIPKSKAFDDALVESTLTILDSMKDVEHIQLEKVNVFLDSLPVKAALKYKGQVLTSNLTRTSEMERISAGKQEVFQKTITSGKISLDYKKNVDPLKDVSLILVPFIAALCAGGIFFGLMTVLENAQNTISEKIDESNRLNDIINNYQNKEDALNKRFDGEIPKEPEQLQAMLKNMLKERDKLDKTIEQTKTKEEHLNKEIDTQKTKIQELNSKIQELKLNLEKRKLSKFKLQLQIN